MYDVIIIGAGASGLMAAVGAARRGRSVLVVDHAGRTGRKLRLSGGGKCNVTNRHIAVSDYFGENNAFCSIALKRFTAKSALDMLREAGIKTEERTHGRIFCRNGADGLTDYLTDTARNVGVQFLMNADVSEVSHTTHFLVRSAGERTAFESRRLLVATGGLAWPQTGASDLGYRIARQFGHRVTPLRPALSGFILPNDSPLLNLQGISLDVQLRINEKSPVIEEPLLFTHRGISGPAALQASCYRKQGDAVAINFIPAANALLLMHEPDNGKLSVKNLFAKFLPERLVRAIIPVSLQERKVAELGRKDRQAIAGYIHAFEVCPSSVEGYSKAEVTMGGVSTEALTPSSMESALTEGLFFSGEVVDITGRLGGYNIHWAFASGHLAGQAI